jgi:short-subunit dehydrogenase
MPIRDLNGKTTLVTGAGTGIGRGIALALARRRAPVVLCGRRLQPLAAVAAEVHSLGGQAAIAQGDVTDPAARLHMLATAHEAFGCVQILVNNAGILAGGSLLQLNGPEIERAVATNLTAPIDLTRLLLPDLAHSYGAAVFVGSTMSHVPLPYASLYSAGKSGLHAFCTSLRYELTPLGIHLLEAYPPAVATAMTSAMARKAARWQTRRASPEDAGERIVTALARGNHEVAWGAGEQWLIRLYRYAPRLLAALFSTQHRRFAHLMTPEPPCGEHCG